MRTATWTIATALLLSPALATAQDDPQARRLAQEILDEGSALFDTRDATAMAATYTQAATVSFVSRDQATGKYKSEVREGRADIEALYRELFSNQGARTTSKNTVQSARRIGNDLLLIQGEFAPDVSQNAQWPFIQVRVKEGEAWRMMSLTLFLVEP